MFSSLFEKFRRKKSKVLKSQEELDAEFKKLQKEYCNIGSSDLYQFLIEYFLTKIELNRDQLEGLNPYSKDDCHKILMLQAQIKVINEFILDIEMMKKHSEKESGIVD